MRVSCLRVSYPSTDTTVRVYDGEQLNSGRVRVRAFPG
jgi:hypothetical protein